MGFGKDLISFDKILNKTKNIMSKDEIADLLKTTPELLDEFENTYKVASNIEEENSDNYFDKGKSFLDNERMQVASNLNKPFDEKYLNNIIDRIVDELILYPVINSEEYKKNKIKLVTKEEINKIPNHLKPQLTGTMVIKDFNIDNYPMILWYYNEAQNTNDPKRKRDCMNQFIAGLDTLDLDPITYAILGENKNSFGHWYPQLEEAIKKQDFFKTPESKYISAPLPILQLTRLGYNSINETTRKIINKYCLKKLNLDVNKDYFVKTGTFSYKFDFRNCRVTKGKEVTELGEYLLYISSYATEMASPLTSPRIIGVSTTNEWVVREYIEDVENNPSIYKGMPLHTEFRLFIDCDTKEIIGSAPYWDTDLLTKRFSKDRDKDSADAKHDYIIVKTHKDILEKRYYDNIELVKENMQNILNNLDLKGQWSIDVMKNGSDYYIIDMALANESALYDCVPKEKRKINVNNWLPEISNE